MPYHFPTFKSHIHIEFMEAYLIMNAHFLGPSHGIPLESLQRYVAFQDHIELNICQPSGDHGSHPGDHPRRRQGLVGLSQKRLDEFPRLEGLWRFSHEMIPRIVDGKLYLARFYRINGPLVPWQCLARLIGSVEPEVCRHIWCSAASSPPFCTVVPIPVTRSAKDAHRPPPGNGLFMVPMSASAESDSCNLCNTDYDISLSHDKDNNQWVFTLSAYHCLGGCRTPGDEYWNLFVHDYLARVADGSNGRQHDRSRRAVRASKHAGSARRKWTEGAQSQAGCKKQEIDSLLDE
ncbi:hypothetical protein TgHK011_002440 [Trichoderma gracile]|nr:hypothetical protein TgHK011_002440 [Trichoderma gracile]